MPVRPPLKHYSHTQRNNQADLATVGAFITDRSTMKGWTESDIIVRFQTQYRIFNEFYDRKRTTNFAIH